MKNNNNLKIGKKTISILSSIILGINGYIFVKNKSLGEDISYETQSPIINNEFNKGDSVISTDNINMRIGTSTDYFKIGLLPKNQTVDRIISLNGFDLIRYDNKLAFVSSDYTNSNIADYNNEYYKVEQDNDIVRTTTQVYFRLGPSKNEKEICLLGKNEELEVMGKSISYNDSNDIWYLAKYKDKIGFLKSDYTRSLKSTIKNFDNSITKVEINKIGYFKYDTSIYDNQNNIIDYAQTYQLVKIISEINNNYIIEYNDTIGIVPKNSINTYKGKFIVVDLSSQKVFLYCNTDMVFESACTTGSNQRRTDTGAFTVYERTNSRFFSEGHEAKYMWANFDHGNGLHDAPWENESKFGNENYRKNNGSNGCVRLPDSAAIFLKEHVKVGTKVLVKD